MLIGIAFFFFYSTSCTNNGKNKDLTAEVVSIDTIPAIVIDETLTTDESNNSEDTVCFYINSKLSELKKEYAYYTKMRMTDYPLELNAIDRIAEIVTRGDSVTLDDFIIITAYYLYCWDEGYFEGTLRFGGYLLRNKQMQSDIIQWSKCLPLKEQHRLYVCLAWGLFDEAAIHFAEQQTPPIPTRLMLDFIRKDLSRNFLNYMDSIGANFYEIFYSRAQEEQYQISAPECYSYYREDTIQ